MNDWKDEDEVAITVGAIKEGLEEAAKIGKQAERERIVAILKEECLCDVDYRCGVHDLIDGILGKANKLPTEFFLQRGSNTNK